MSSLKIRVCGNVETVADMQFVEESGADWREECVREVTSDLFDWIADKLASIYNIIEVDSNFRDWHGGRYDQFWTRRGFVAINFDAPSAVELCDEIDDRFKDLLDTRASMFDAEGRGIS